MENLTYDNCWRGIANENLATAEGGLLMKMWMGQT